MIWMEAEDVVVRMPLALPPTAAGDPVRASRLFGAANAHREAVGGARRRHMDAIYEPDAALARSLLDPEGWHAAWTAGRTMPLDQAVAYALADSAADDRCSDA